jgi:uncharacterized Tic20 family protein
MCTPFIQLVILFIPIPFLIIIAVIIGGFLPTLMWLRKRNKALLINIIGKQHLNYNLTSLLLIAIELTVLNYSPDGALYKIIIGLINFYQLIGFFVIWASTDEISQQKTSAILPKLSIRFIS